MADTMTTSAPAAPPGLTPKAERTAAFLAAHVERMDRLSVRWECSECRGLIGKYRPPIGWFEEPCRKCGVMNVLTTEPVSTAS